MKKKKKKKKTIYSEVNRLRRYELCSRKLINFICQIKASGERESICIQSSNLQAKIIKILMDQFVKD